MNVLLCKRAPIQPTVRARMYPGFVYASTRLSGEVPLRRMAPIAAWTREVSMAVMRGPSRRGENSERIWISWVPMNSRQLGSYEP